MAESFVTKESVWTPLAQPLDPGDERRTCAVIDIGSNSVRLVIYDGPSRAPFPICNEKALCGLGRSLGDDGTLDPEARAAALATLTRFRRILRDFGDPPVHAVATAAVREARDGNDFVRAAEEIGFEIDVITGEREAELAGLGVISFEPAAQGLVGDMGGGSLELIDVESDGAANRQSLSVGPLRLMARHGTDRKAAQKDVVQTLSKISWLKKSRGQTFYMVGGAWRAIAKLHMRENNHPLSVLHHYDMSVSSVIDICSNVAQMDGEALTSLPGISRRRLETLPHAAIVLRAVLERVKPANVFVSAAGLREGLLFENLPDRARRHDPLIAGGRFLARRLSPAPAVGEAVWAMIEPLFARGLSGADLDIARVGRATALMIDIGAFFHPDLRAIHAFDTALRAPLQGLNHAERVKIAVALFTRHEGTKTPLPDEAVLRLISEDERTDAVRLGLAMRFAGAFAPKSARAIAGARLTLEGENLCFTAPTDRAPLMQELARRRLDALAAAFGKAASIQFV